MSTGRKLLQASILVIGTMQLGSCWRERQQDFDLSEVERTDDRLRLAMLANNSDQIEKLVDPDYVGVNQNGTKRTRAELISLFRAYSLRSLRVHSRRATGDKREVVLSGVQTNVDACGRSDDLDYTRVYRKGESGWRLLSMRLTRTPHPAAPSK